MILTFAPYGQELEIKRINADENTSRRLNSLGLMVGSKLTLVSAAGGSCIIRCMDSKLALDRTLAMKITVA
ncbi:MAG: ferrous iron transport protein A [Clostridiales bacterium]|jgi:ferrous iron transport protein A|nr:ferrous iron transport protein A [Clostridiales bacterium]